MKNHPLTENQITDLLSRSQTGSLATLNADGSPYNIPVHFVYENSKLYFHGLPRGQKIDNIIRDARVSFTAYEMQDILLDSEGKPCDTNTKYESVIIEGKASIMEDGEDKLSVLEAVVKKYTPHLQNIPLPEAMVRGTAVIQIDVVNITGKYYG